MSFAPEGSRTWGLFESEMQESSNTTIGPAFYNRIDETVVFDAFDAGTVELVARKEIDGLVRKLKRRNVHLEVDAGVVHLLRRVGFDPVYGARGLSRAIRNTLTEPVAHYVISRGSVGRSFARARNARR
ncbi:hypothetical protein [Mycobacterium sp. URHB0021]|jgi:ATP-dependent Clp protease ATP-binding subunit ClpA